jgi:hypothetical protein
VQAVYTLLEYTVVHFLVFILFVASTLVNPDFPVESPTAAVATPRTMPDVSVPPEYVIVGWFSGSLIFTFQSLARTLAEAAGAAGLATNEKWASQLSTCALRAVQKATVRSGVPATAQLLAQEPTDSHTRVQILVQLDTQLHV